MATLGARALTTRNTSRLPKLPADTLKRLQKYSIEKVDERSKNHAWIDSLLERSQQAKERLSSQEQQVLKGAGFNAFTIENNGPLKSLLNSIIHKEEEREEIFRKISARRNSDSSKNIDIEDTTPKGGEINMEGAVAYR